MKWKILKYIDDDARSDCYLCENEEGKREYIDLFTDSSYKNFGNITKPGGDIDKKRKSIVGKTVDIEEIFPYTPLYFGKNVKLISL